METSVIAALVGAMGGLLTGIIGAIVTLKSKGVDKVLEDRKLWVTAYDMKMLEQRLLEYKKLWKLTEPTSRRYVSSLSLDSAESLAEKLTNWYYSDGGMILSEDSRDSFFNARNSLTRFDDQTQCRSNVVKCFSSLRTAICEDMNARKGPTLKPKEE